MKASVKRAISIRKEQDERLQALARRRRAPYSRLVQEAVELYLRAEEHSRIAQAYKRYFADRGNSAGLRRAARGFPRPPRKGR